MSSFFGVTMPLFIIPELATRCHYELTSALPLKRQIHHPMTLPPSLPLSVSPSICLSVSVSLSLPHLSLCLFLSLPPPLQNKVIACSTLQSPMQIKLQPVNHYSPPQHRRFHESPTPVVDAFLLDVRSGGSSCL